MTLDQVITALVIGTGGAYIAAVLLLIVFLIRTPMQGD